MNDARTVILHASQNPHDVTRAVNSARHLHAAHPELDVRVIVNGSALDGLLASGAPSAPDGVRVQACAVGLGKRGADADALPRGVETVPGAITTIVEAELAGAVYVRI
ncbi:hypothetical protein BMIN_0637 [Bifidobacterium minimum]|jgi:intracellular sulfur oxidation DsrE/DsrF family protein|uniref:DsrE/DsrF-like family protein n=1 Tax=Bifidobacterium minimum TaxID=1693 RepID=A0A087BQE9_9BIFI|nr:hypothetical protein [Bifidobacterium minimum]KFI73249.1 hypothetical protein BMIN_0637 [Bifidobacterium minimum]MCH4158873.1 hypothetical protein [Bifidobacterium minimum]